MSSSGYPLPTVSPTQVRTYQRCPLAYKHRFLERWTGIQSAAGLLGHAVHSAIEAALKAKRRFRQDPSAEEMERIFDRVWDRGLPPETETAGASREEFDSVREEGYDMLSFYLEEVALKVRPHLVEQRFSFELEGVPVPVVGQVDLIETDGVVVDHKTSLRPYREDYLDNDVQLFCYAVGYAFFRLGVQARKGVIPPAFMVGDARVDVIVRGAEPRLQQIRKKYSNDDLNRIAEVLRDIAMKIGSGVFPAFWEVEDRDEPWRTCDSCGYRDRCDMRIEAQDEDRGGLEAGV